MDLHGIQFPSDRLADMCQRYEVVRLSIFGSILGDRFGPRSDIDVLVEFAPGRTPGLFRLGGLQQELSALLGRDVDLKTPGFLPRRFREEVVRSAQVQYAA